MKLSVPFSASSEELRSLSNGLSVYLFEKSVTCFGDAITPKPGWSQSNIQENDISYPAQLWLRLNALSDSDLPIRLGGLVDLGELKPNRNSSAVLFLKISSRIVAVAFGAGRFLLDKLRIVSDFGLVVATGVNAAEQVRQVSAKQTGVNGATIHVTSPHPIHIRQAVPPIYQQLCMIEPARTVQFPMKIEGRRALRFLVAGQVTEILCYIEDAINIYVDSGVMKFAAFPCQPERIPRNSWIIPACNAELISMLNNPVQDDRIVLDIPAWLGESDLQPIGLEVDSAIISVNEDSWIDVQSVIQKYLIPLSLESLQNIKVLFGDFQQPERVGLTDVISAEVLVGEFVCVLEDGGWWKVQESFQDYAEYIFGEMESVGEGLILPPWKSGIPERDYNTKVSQSLSFLNLDLDLWRSDGAIGFFELADLVTPDRSLICVKRCGSKAECVGVANQAITSMQNLYGREDVRNFLFSRELEFFGEVREIEQRRVVLGIQLNGGKISVRQLSIGQRMALLNFAVMARSLGFVPGITYIPTIFENDIDFPQAA